MKLSKKLGIPGVRSGTGNYKYSWPKFNELIMETEDEKRILDLMRHERAGHNRKTFLRRAHSRLNKLRAARERGELKDPEKK